MRLIWRVIYILVIVVYIKEAGKRACVIMSLIRATFKIITFYYPFFNTSISYTRVLLIIGTTITILKILRSIES